MDLLTAAVAVWSLPMGCAVADPPGPAVVIGAGGAAGAAGTVEAPLGEVACVIGWVVVSTGNSSGITSTSVASDRGAEEPERHG